MGLQEHLDACPYEGLVAAEDCEWCSKLGAPCWTTKGGKAYHTNKDCPALHEKRVHPALRTTLQMARGGHYQACETCVNGVCRRCGDGRHRSCDPKDALLAACSCAGRGHVRDARQHDHAAP
jgi:hypothetical protein